MPNTESAKKALRQSEKRRVRNLTQKRFIKKTIKRYESLLGSGNIDEAKTQLITVYKSLDKAAKVGVIKNNKASRLKSRLTKRLGKIENPTQTEAPAPAVETNKEVSVVSETKSEA